MVERKKNTPQNTQHPDRWLKGYYFATWVLALIAIVSFVFSIWSWIGTSKAVEKITGSLGSFAYPVLQIDDHDFLGDNTGKISCQNSPTGILIYYANKSNVPIQIYKTEKNFFFGERRIGQNSIHKIGGSENSILVPGDRRNFGVTDEVLTEQLKKTRPFFAGPHIEIKFEAEYSRLGEEKRYLYQTHYVIQFDCNAPEYKTSYFKLESIKPIN